MLVSRAAVAAVLRLPPAADLVQRLRREPAQSKLAGDPDASSALRGPSRVQSLEGDQWQSSPFYIEDGRT
jgi:hypothetical protein